MENIINVKFRIKSIEKEEYSTTIDGIDLSAMDESNLAFQYRISTEFNLTEDEIVVRPEIRYKYNQTQVFVGGADVVFYVQDLSSIVKIDSDKMQLDISVDILPTLLSAAYSTLRGLVHTQLIGTPLASFPIPLLEVNNLLTKNGLSVRN